MYRRLLLQQDLPLFLVLVLGNLSDDIIKEKDTLFALQKLSEGGELIINVMLLLFLFQMGGQGFRERSSIAASVAYVPSRDNRCVW